MIATTTSLCDFRAPALRLLGDRSRVGWTETRGVVVEMDSGGRALFPNGHRAAAVMRATAALNVRCERPAYHVTVWFAPEDRPSERAVWWAAYRTLRDLGLQDHQSLVVRHTDADRAHVHLLVNRVHPETGRAWDRWGDARRLRATLEAQERVLGVRPTGRNAVPPGTAPPGATS